MDLRTIIARKNSIQRLGNIITSSVDPNYIGNTVRALFGTMKCDKSTSTYLKLDSVIDLTRFLELDMSLAGFGFAETVMGEELSTVSVRFTNSTTVAILLRLPGSGSIAIYNLTIPSLVLNTRYKFGFLGNPSTSTIAFYLNDVFIGNISGAELSVLDNHRKFNIIGARAVFDTDNTARQISNHLFYSVRNENVKWEFNEVGNSPLCKTTRN
jgi:hypothetical protein